MSARRRQKANQRRQWVIDLRLKWAAIQGREVCEFTGLNPCPYHPDGGNHPALNPNPAATVRQAS